MAGKPVKEILFTFLSEFFVPHIIYGVPGSAVGVRNKGGLQCWIKVRESFNQGIFHHNLSTLKHRELLVWVEITRVRRREQPSTYSGGG